MSKSKSLQDLKVGDSAVVKTGVTDPDFGTDLGGWQGRITEIHHSKQEGELVTIRWDSVTLKQMPGSLIEQCEERGLDWAEYVLLADEVERADPRDSEQDTAQVARKLAAEYAWSYLGAQGRRIGRVLAGVDYYDVMACLHAWEAYLAEHLAFPFEAEVNEPRDQGPLEGGDRLKVTGITLVDDLYGLIVDAWRGRRKYAALLCDLAVVDERSPNHDLVQDYRVWFANR